MKVSMQWLGDYVEMPGSPQELRDNLSMSGLVVEAMTPFGGDTVLEVEVTANRPDCLNHIGIAREIATLYGRPLGIPAVRGRSRLRSERVDYDIEIRDPDLCPRYNGLVLDGVRVGTSPPWMQRRLEACGMRPINSIVDITNYVMLEMGHPLHAFDFDLLQGGKIIVQRATAGERMVTLDGVERVLDPEMLMIRDAVDPVAIAGVMGGIHSEISLKTTRVLLECAYFLPRSIRRTSKRLGLSTEASYRFERGVDWDGTTAAIGRTRRLIEELAGGRLAGSLRDAYPARLAPARIELRRDHAESVLGASLEDAFIERTLKGLHFKPRRMGKGKWLVTCPTYRADMELEADLIEEIARFFGYQNIPTTVPPARTAGMASPVKPHESAARELLLGMGYSEAVNLSFSGEHELQLFAAPSAEAPEIKNPLTEETRFLRTSLAPGLVMSAKRNFSHDIRRVCLFEIGKVFWKDGEGLPLERRSLGILGTGGFAGSNWRHPSSEYDFFHLKGAVTAFLEGLHGAEAEILPGAEVRWLNPACAATLKMGGERLGMLGSLHPRLQEEYKLRQPVYLAEIDFEALCRSILLPVRYQPLPRYPSMERDLSLLLSRDIPFGEIRAAILAISIPELTRIDLVDVYEGDSIAPDKISMTVRLTFLDRASTLTIDRVQGFSDNVVALLRQTYGAQRR